MYISARLRTLNTVRIVPTHINGGGHRGLHYTPRLATKHNADTYAKDDVDATPPPSESSVYKIDTTTDTVQKPSERIPNLDSRETYADVKRPNTKGKGEAYRHTDSTYKTEGGPGLRYGGKEELSKDKGPETSKADEGPERQGAAGRV